MSEVVERKHYKFLLLMAMLYMSFMLADQVMMYRFVQVGPFFLTAGVFIMPLYYFFGDLITEVYGYQISKQLIWGMVICCIVFAGLIAILNDLPVPLWWHGRIDYTTVLGRLLRSSIGGAAVAVVAGSFVNAYIISKWKILVKGKYFVLRSIGSSAFGEAVQMVLGCLLIFLGTMPLRKLMILMVELYVVQIGLAMVIACVGTYFVNALKITEGINTYDNGVNFNPFSIKRRDT